MIRCDLCKGWFHEECIKVEEGDNVNSFWMCEECGEEWQKVKAMRKEVNKTSSQEKSGKETPEAGDQRLERIEVEIDKIKKKEKELTKQIEEVRGKIVENEYLKKMIQRGEEKLLEVKKMIDKLITENGLEKELRGKREEIEIEVKASKGKDLERVKDDVTKIQSKLVNIMREDKILKMESGYSTIRGRVTELEDKLTRQTLRGWEFRKELTEIAKKIKPNAQESEEVTKKGEERVSSNEEIREKGEVEIPKKTPCENPIRKEGVGRVLILGDEGVRRMERGIIEGLDRKKVTIASFPGANLQDIKKLVGKGIIHKEETRIVLHVGSNKSKKWEDRFTFKKEWEELVETIKERGEGKSIGVCPIPTRPGGNKMAGETVKIKNKILAEICEQKGVEYLQRGDLEMDKKINMWVGEHIEEKN